MRRIRDYLEHYSAGGAVEETIFNCLSSIRSSARTGVWISIKEADVVESEIRSLERRKENGENLPLYGVPFAVKDNIDVAGMPTTAGCREFNTMPEQDAFAVSLLKAAGAIAVGKTNLDQFATGLVGTRSPYGQPTCFSHPEYISGGSSSGSAVAVALELVPFSLGTDTAGSGRVPAAFNGLVGFKGTRGLISTRGVFPACRSLDCVTTFTHDIPDARLLAGILGVFDPLDPYSRRRVRRRKAFQDGAEPQIAIPHRCQLEFFGDDEASSLFADFAEKLRAEGSNVFEADFTPFFEGARLLYEGPWVAERTAALESFMQENAPAMNPIVGEIVLSGRKYSAVDAFRAAYKLAELQRHAAEVLNRADCLLLPTTPTHFRIEEVEQDPFRTNSRLGIYTNFVNLFDLAAIAIPAGNRADDRPFGASLIGSAWSEETLFALAEPQSTRRRAAKPADNSVEIAVCGAHLRGMPLNKELVALGAVFQEASETASAYRMFLISGEPPKPALVKDAENGGISIPVEVYRLNYESFGKLVSRVPAPLAIGTVDLLDGRQIKGFVGEAKECLNLTEITDYGSWRGFISSRSS